MKIVKNRTILAAPPPHLPNGQTWTIFYDFHVDFNDCRSIFIDFLAIPLPDLVLQGLGPLVSV